MKFFTTLKLIVIKKSLLTLTLFSLIFVLVQPDVAYPQPQEKPTVISFEMDLYTNSSISDPSADKFWKERLEEIIKENLDTSKREGKIHEYEHYLKRHADRILDPQNWCNRLGIQYLIDGEIAGTTKDILRVSIRLYDYKKQGENHLVYARERHLKKDLKTLEYWFDKLSRSIRTIIEGGSPKDVIYTYCFFLDDTEDIEARRQKIIKLGFPMKLAEKLQEKLGDRYIFETFTSQVKMAKACMQEKDEEDLGMDMEKGDFMLKGYVKTDLSDEDYYIVNVEIYEMGKFGEPKKLVEGFRKKYSPNFFEELAERIKMEWNKTLIK